MQEIAYGNERYQEKKKNIKTKTVCFQGKKRASGDEISYQVG